MKTINNLLLLLLTIGSPSTATAQITVWDLMDLPVGGCPIPVFQDTATTEPVWIPPIQRNFPYVPTVAPPPPLPKQTISPDSLRQIFLPYLAKDYPGGTPDDLTVFTNREVTLYLSGNEKVSSGLTRFLSGNRYGLKSENGDTLIPAIYHYIEASRNKTHFIGYGSRYTNIYNLNNQPLFSKRYLHVRPIRKEHYVVQGPKGYGLIDATGNELLPCKYWLISEINSQGKLTVLVQDSKSTAFIFLIRDDFKIRIPAPSGYSFLLKDRYLSVSNGSQFFDLKTKKNLSCGQPFHISVFDDEASIFKLLSKSSNSLHQGTYPFLPGGELLFQDTTITTKSAYRKQISVLKWTKGKPRPLRGLADKFGNWLIQPIYKDLHNLTPPYVVATLEDTPYDRIGVIDQTDGTVVIPFDFHTYQHKSSDKFLALFRRGDDAGQPTTTLFQLPDLNKVLTSDGELVFQQATLCGDTVLITQKENKFLLLYPDGTPVVSDTFNFINTAPTGDHLIARMADRSKIKIDCGGKLMKLSSTKLDLPLSSIGDSIHLKKNPQGKLTLKTPNGEYLVDSRFKKISSVGFRDLIILYDKRGNNAIMNSRGKILLPNFRGYMAPPTATKPYLKIAFSDCEASLDVDGQLFLEGKYEKTGPLKLGLTGVLRRDWGTIVNNAGEEILPLSQAVTRIIGGMIVRDSTKYYRDGSLINE